MWFRYLNHYGNKGGWVGLLVSFLTFHFQNPVLNPAKGHYVDWVFSLYLTVWGFSWNNFSGVFLPHLRPKLSFLVFSLWVSWLVQWLKTLDTIGNCQRPVFSLGVSQHMQKITNLWKFELNCSSKLWDNNKRKNTLVTWSCVLSDPCFRDLKF